MYVRTYLGRDSAASPHLFGNFEESKLNSMLKLRRKVSNYRRLITRRRLGDFNDRVKSIL